MIRSPGRPACMLRIVSVATAMLVSIALAALPVRAAISEAGISADSEIELLEKTTFGIYQQYQVRIATRDGTARIEASKDNAQVAMPIASPDVLHLWKQVLRSGLEFLDDSTETGLPPDQSFFTIRYRVGAETRTFTVYAVDWLKDGRYREIVNAILDLADGWAGSALDQSPTQGGQR